MTVVLAAGPARLEVDPADGGRMMSLQLGGHELLYAAGADPTMHGSFVMAPYAGRVRDGRFSVAGREVHLPLTLPPHAGHGLVLDRAWTVREQSATTVRLDCVLDERWPWPGRVEQRIELAADQVRQTVTVHADGEAFPASLGWHPWFARRPSGWPPGRVELDAGAMLVRDVHYIATEHRVVPPPGPWDDCFVDVHWPVTLTWPGVLALEVSADTAYVVVFDSGDVAACVEPQTHPPDALNTGAALVRPGRPLEASMLWAWRLA
jgi:aldose 1-epimerase